MKNLTIIEDAAISTYDAEQFVARVQGRIKNILTEFVFIGKELKEAKERKLYKYLDYDSLEDLAQELFSIKKSTCYNLIKLYEKCSDGEKLLPEYEGFSQSQLVELISVKTLPEKFLHIETPSDSAKKIRKAVKLWDERCENNEMPEVVENVKSIDELIEKFSSRLENDDLNSSQKAEISEKIRVLELVKNFLEENNCVCFLAPKSKKRAKNNKFIEKLETYITTVVD